jgi:Mce-associated membrane protein
MAPKARTSQSPDEDRTPVGSENGTPAGNRPPGGSGTPAGSPRPGGSEPPDPGDGPGKGTGERRSPGRRSGEGRRTTRGPAGRPARATGLGPGAEPRGSRSLLAVALTLAVAAAVAAALAGWSWYGAAHDDGAAFARTRDTVLAAGEQAVQNLNTLDHADLDHGLDIWESSTTGDLHTQLAQGRADFAKQVQQARTTSTAKVLSGAVTELDTRTGRAAVMVALRITVQAPNAQPAVKESRMLGELTRTADGWKLSALGQAPMGDSAPDPAATGPAAATPAAPTTPQPAASR